MIFDMVAALVIFCFVLPVIWDVTFDLLAGVVRLFLRLLMVLLFSVPVMGQQLPDKPVVDREFKVEAAALGAAWGLDFGSTKWKMDRCRLCVERGGVSNGTREIVIPALVWGAVDIASVALAYELKKHVRGPWWRLPMMIRTGEHIGGIAVNFKL